MGENKKTKKDKAIFVLKCFVITTIGIATYYGVKKGMTRSNDSDALTEAMKEAFEEFVKNKGGRPGIETTLWVAYDFPSRKAAAEFLGGSDSGISQAYSSGQDLYLGAQIF